MATLLQNFSSSPKACFKDVANGFIVPLSSCVASVFLLPRIKGRMLVATMRGRETDFPLCVFIIHHHEAFHRRKGAISAVASGNKNQ